MSGPHAVHRAFRVGETPTTRIESFSDGVFSIVCTLLILTIQVPHLHGDVSRELPRALHELVPNFLSFALSFGIVIIWWAAHHNFFVVLARADRGLMWLNSLFLFWLVTVPVPTSLLGEYPDQRIAVVCYGAVMTLAGISFTWMRFCAFYVGKLTHPEIDRRLLRQAMRKSLMNPLLHLVAVSLAWVNPMLSIGLYVAIPVLFFLPSGLDKAIAAGNKS